MIDMKMVRSHPERVRELILKKEPQFDVDKLIGLDVEIRKIRYDVEELRQKKNDLAGQVGVSGLTDELRAQSIDIGKKLKEKSTLLEAQEEQFTALQLSCPNLPHDDVPVGNKESNRVIKVVGEKPTYGFEVKNHVDIATGLDWLDFQRAAVMSGNNFALYKGDAVALLYSLAMMMIKHNKSYGFKPILPPYLVKESALQVASNFPKFKDQVYALPQDNLYLSPTAEVNLSNMYRNHVFMANDLPNRMTAWTSCFRREAGGYGAHERGLIRIHQFEKVELYSLCTPEESEQELQKMTACAEALLQKLGLHYRVSLLAAQDCSFPSAKTYDIEVWLPGQKEYYEVSSCSNCTDFQARRGNIKYKKEAGGKSALVHTLNASSLALPRLMVALIETYQQEDGSIELPEGLQKELLF